jgi:hypothetical protein
MVSVQGRDYLSPQRAPLPAPEVAERERDRVEGLGAHGGVALEGVDLEPASVGEAVHLERAVARVAVKRRADEKDTALSRGVERVLVHAGIRGRSAAPSARALRTRSPRGGGS